MRGAREVFYEYILELRGRTDEPGRPRRRMHVTAGEYHGGTVFGVFRARTRRDRQCELSVKLGGTTRLCLVLYIGRGF